MSDRLQRFFMWVLAIAVVGGTIAALRYARGYRPLAGFGFTGPTDLPAGIALRFNHVRVVARDKNRVAWTVTAGQVQTTQTQSHLDFYGGVEARLMQNGAPRAILAAPQTTYDADMRTLIAAGRVTCRIFPEGMTGDHTADKDLNIRASEVIWKIGSNIVTCPGIVETTVPGLDMKGSDLTVNLTTREINLKQVHADMTIYESDSDENTSPLSLKGYTP